LGDPLGEFERSVEDILVYLDTAFATRWREVNEERNDLLSSTEELFQVPFIEVLPNFRSSEQLPSDLSILLQENGVDVEVADLFTQMMQIGLLYPLHQNDVCLYQHQTRLLTEAVSGRHCVITSPTGSGKTEAFLMPLFVHLARELRDASQMGPAPQHGPHRNDWWRGGTIRSVSQNNRAEGLHNPETDLPISDWWVGKINDGESPYVASHPICQQNVRQPGLRALMIYPLNALIDDQMRRLRFALDSQEMHDFYQAHLNGHTPRFARYNSSTIGGASRIDDVTKLDSHYNGPGFAAQIRNKIETPFTQMYYAMTGNQPEVGALMSAHEAVEGKNPEDGFVVQNPWGCEQRFRWDIQTAVPDLMVTNLSQLQVLAARTTSNDENIFQQTLEYLQDENARFHLVLDELHLYRGSSGSETAFSLRIILNRLQLLPGQQFHNRLKILASSASLDSGDEGTFLTEFFGVPFEAIPEEDEPGFHVESGELAEVSDINPLMEQIPTVNIPVEYQPFVDFAQSSGDDASIGELTAAFNCSNGTTVERLYQLLESTISYTQNLLSISQESTDEGYRLRPSSVWNIAEEFFGLPSPDEFQNRMESDAWFAVRGLLKARSILQELGYAGDSARCRIHTMLRNIPGLAAIAEPGVGVENEYSFDSITGDESQRKVGKLYPTGRNFVNVNGQEYRSLECLYCEDCSDIFFSGFRSRPTTNQSPWRFTLTDSDPSPDDSRNQALPPRVEQQNHLNFAIFWPRGQESIHEETLTTGNDNLPLYGFQWGIDARYNWMPARLNPQSGEILQVIGPPDQNTGWPLEQNSDQLIQDGFTVEGFTPRLIQHTTFEGNTPGEGMVHCDYSVGSDSESAMRRLPALPPHCPSCGQERRYMASQRTGNRRSPLRGFRTSQEELSNLNIRSLFVGLPENPSRKLIAFSDSRDRAARLASNVAIRHREAVIASSIISRARDLTISEPEYVRRIHAGEVLDPTSEDFVEKYSSEYLNPKVVFTGDLNQAMEESAMMLLQNPFLSQMAESISNRGLNSLTENRLKYRLEESLSYYNSDSEQFPSITKPIQQPPSPGSERLPPLAKQLLLLGMNPAGFSPEAIEPIEAPDTENEAWLSVLNNLQNDPPIARNVGWSQTDAGINSNMSMLLREDACNSILSGRNTPYLAGLGWFELEPNQQVLQDEASYLGIDSDLLHSITIGYVQYLLTKRRYFRPTGTYQNEWAQGSMTFSPGRGKGYFEGVARGLHERGIQILTLSNQGPARALFLAIIGRELNHPRTSLLVTGYYEALDIQGYIDTRLLNLRLAEDDEPVVLCQTCKYPHYIQIAQHHQTCTRCYSNLDLDNLENHTTASWLRERNQLGRRMQEGDLHRIPIRVEELTGQTDDYGLRQRHFRGILTAEEEERDIVTEIDVLSVTTTVEVGVDLGSLTAVYLSNMPPQRFNYQQRVGRAGRRGQAFSEARTACTDSSHDGHYFRHPERITGDICPLPSLTMNQFRIARRVFAKECLRLAFRQPSILDRQNTPDNYVLIPRPPDVHGEFGRCLYFIDENNNPTDNAADIESWLQDESNVISIAESLVHGLDNIEWSAHNLVNYACNGDLYNDICQVVRRVMDMDSDSNRNTDRDENYLAQTLAENGVLPMANTPTEQRNLYHATAKRRISTIDRSIEQAITMFAPGTITTKDKQKHLAIGITGDIPLTNGQRRTNQQISNPWTWRDHLTIDTRTNALIHVGNPENIPDDVAVSEFTRTYVAIKPAGFRSVLHQLDQDAWNNDTGGSSTSLMYHHSAAGEGQILQGCRYSLDAGENGGIVYLLNDKSGEGFTFNHVIEANSGPIQRPLQHQWIERSVRENLEGFSGENPARIAGFYGPDAPVLTHGDSEITDVALTSPKTTDVFWVHPDGGRQHLTLDPYIGGSNRPGVRAAYRSAAYILRAAICDELDIDPVELEVVNLAPIGTNQDRVGRIILSDRDPNGAGFAVSLNDNLQDIFSVIIGEEPENGQWTWLRMLVSEEHQNSCQSSCTDCIRYYSNQNEHGLMDWRLGLDLLRVLANENENHFANVENLEDTLSQLPANDYRSNLLVYMETLAGRLVNAGGSSMELRNFGELPGAFNNHTNKAYILVHPLWLNPGNTGSVAPIITNAMLQAIQVGINPENIVVVDTFNAERRASWSIHGLVN